MLLDVVGPWMEKRGWPLCSDALGRLEVLLDLWCRYGAVMNLSGARTRPELLPHVLDGLDTAWLVRNEVGEGGEFHWVDVGSGGGFPGLVIAAVGTWSLTLVEPRQKRASFLELALRAIEKGSVDVRRSRYDGATWDEEPMSGVFRASEPGMRIASARAVWAPSEWLEIGSHVVHTGGHVVLHLGGAESAEDFGATASVESERGRIAVVTAR